MEKVSILGIGIDNLSLTEACIKVEQYIEEKEPSLIVTANPEIIWLARHNNEFSFCLRQASMITADGIGVILAAKILGTPIKQRVTGIDLTTALFKIGAQKQYKFYFLGGKPGIAERAATNIRKDYPDIQIIGVQHGYFKDDQDILKDIERTKPDILLVALGMGKQEKWITEKAFQVGVPVSIGVGGSFDVLSGEVKRAPKLMQKTGTEWLYRLITQPSRIGRMLQLPKFLIAVVWARFTGKHY